MPSPLADALDRAEFVSLSLCRTGNEWQANLNVEGGSSWRIRTASTPSEALSEVLGVFPASPPPLPY